MGRRQTSDANTGLDMFMAIFKNHIGYLSTTVLVFTTTYTFQKFMIALSISERSLGYARIVELRRKFPMR